VLAGLPQAPSLYDPLTNLTAAKARQLEVLQAMAKYGYIKPSQVQGYYNAPLHLSPQTVTAANIAAPYPYPWYIQHVVSILKSKGFTPSEIYDGGLKIHTELDPTIYTIAQNSVTQWMNYNFGSNPAYQASAVVEDPHTGAIWAVIGQRSYHGADLNDMALTAQRSSGSSIKPLMEYTEAIIKGYTQMSVIQDVPIFQKVNGQPWWPKNDDRLYRGYMTLRDALAISDNDVAVHLLHDIGIQYGFDFATEKFGLKLPESDSTELGIAIGGFSHGGVTNYEMTQAYATFPNGGVRMKPLWVTKVVDANGAAVYQQNPQGTALFSPQVAYIMETMMERVMYPGPIPNIGPGSNPTGVDLGIGRPAAGKTGTNNGEADAWFLGYEPQMVVGVWEGNQYGEIPQPNTPDGPAYGDVAAGPIWKQIMEQVNHAEHIVGRPFSRPSGIIYLRDVSITSGMLAGPLTPKNDIQGAWFIQGTQPTRIGHHHIDVKVPATNPNELWEPGCGPAINAVFLVPESDWHKGVPLPWDSIFWPPTAQCQPNQQARAPIRISPNQPIQTHDRRPNRPSGSKPRH